MDIVPASIIIVTKDISKENLTLFEQTLGSLDGFDDVIVVHSGSDKMIERIVHKNNTRLHPFTWNKKYPKKRQWCLDNIQTKYNWIFFLDADEIMFPNLAKEISTTLKRPDINQYAGFFIKGGYIWNGTPLRHGLKNNKITLLHKKRCHYPIVNDLSCNAMGEIEGHYQPIPYKQYKIGQLKSPVAHYAFIDKQQWIKRHKKYAQWEAHMIKRNAYPKDPLWARQAMKQIFRKTPWRSTVAFCHCYIIKKGILDGKAGLEFAQMRYRYYKTVKQQHRLSR